MSSVVSKESICHTIQVLQMRPTHMNMVDMLILSGEEDLVVEVVDFMAGHLRVALEEGKHVVC